MSATCAAPLSPHVLADYWAGDLPREESERVEEHVFGCAACASASSRVAAIVTALRSTIPPIVSPSELEALRARGLALVDGYFRPGERREVVFAEGTDLLVHHLGGLALEDAERVHVTVRLERGGILFEQPIAPFDRARGEVLVACQRHFAELPPDVVFDVQVHREGGARDEVATYVIPHVFGGVTSPG